MNTMKQKKWVLVGMIGLAGLWTSTPVQAQSAGDKSSAPAVPEPVTVQAYQCKTTLSKGDADENPVKAVPQPGKCSKGPCLIGKVGPFRFSVHEKEERGLLLSITSDSAGTSAQTFVPFPGPDRNQVYLLYETNTYQVLLECTLPQSK